MSAAVVDESYDVQRFACRAAREFRNSFVLIVAQLQLGINEKSSGCGKRRRVERQLQPGGRREYISRPKHRFAVKKNIFSHKHFTSHRWCVFSTFTTVSFPNFRKMLIKFPKPRRGF